MGKKILWSAIMLGLMGLSVLYFWRFFLPQPVFPVQGEYLQVEHYKLFSVQHGEGRTILLLSGFPYHSEMYQAMTKQVIPGYRFLAVDLPGTGYSDKKLNKPLTPEDLALIMKLMLDQLDIKSVDIVGHDLGGGVALVMAGMFPQLVQRVVLLSPDSSAGAAGDSWGWWWHVPVIRELWSAIFLDRSFMRRVLRESWDANQDTWHALVERYTHPLDMPKGRQGFLYIHRGRVGFDYLPYEENIKVPVGIFWGEQDRVLPPAVGQRLAQILENAQLELLPGVGHLMTEQAPQEVWQHIQAFLNRTPIPEPVKTLAIPDQPVTAPEVETHENSNQ